MKRMMLAVVVGILSATSARGEFIIDNFPSPSTTVGDFVSAASNGPTAISSGTRTVAVTAGARVIYGSPTGTFRFHTTGTSLATQTATLTYALTNAINMNEAKTLLLNIFGSVSGNYNVDVTLSSTGNGSFSFSTLAVIGAASVPAQSFNGLLAPNAIRSAVDGITIVVRKTAPGFFSGFSKDVGAKISAIPEPSSVLLLVGTGVCGFVAHRRRRKIQQAV